MPDKAKNIRNTSDRKYHHTDANDNHINPSYSKSIIDPWKSAKIDRGRLKANVNKAEEYLCTNRSRSEGSTEKWKTIKNLNLKDQNLNINKASLFDNYELRRKDRVIATQEDGQLIYTFRDQNDSVENYEEDQDKNKESSTENNIYNQKYAENTVKMDRSDLLYNTIGKTGDSLSQTLLSLKSKNKEFYNTGKCIENMNSSDYNILKSNKNDDENRYWSIERNSQSSKYRSISTKRISKTDRRDAARARNEKAVYAKEIRDESIESTEFQGFQALVDLQKKYNRLKRHYRKEK